MKQVIGSDVMKLITAFKQPYVTANTVDHKTFPRPKAVMLKSDSRYFIVMICLILLRTQVICLWQVVTGLSWAAGHIREVYVKWWLASAELQTT